MSVRECLCCHFPTPVFLFVVRKRFYFSPAPHIMRPTSGWWIFMHTQKKNAPEKKRRQRRRQRQRWEGTSCRANRHRRNELNWVSVGNVYWICFSHATHTHTTEKATPTNWEIKGTKESKSDCSKSDNNEWKLRTILFFLLLFVFCFISYWWRTNTIAPFFFSFPVNVLMLSLTWQKSIYSLQMIGRK